MKQRPRAFPTRFDEPNSGATIKHRRIPLGGCNGGRELVATCYKKLDNLRLKDLSEGEVLASFVSELSSIANWGHLGREKSQKLQLVVAAYFLLIYTIFAVPIIASPSGEILGAFPIYHLDTQMLRASGIVALTSGVVAFILQLLLPQILQLQS